MSARAGVSEAHGLTGGLADIRICCVLEHFFNLFLRLATLFRTIKDELRLFFCQRLAVGKLSRIPLRESTQVVQSKGEKGTDPVASA